MKKYLDFKICYINGKEKSEYFEATVPGNAQLDYAKKYNLPDYIYSDNYKQWKFLEDYCWEYMAELPGVDGDLVIKGIDYQYKVFIDDKEVLDYEGMFKRHFVPVSKDNKILKIFVDKVPKRADADEGRHQADNVCKPPVSYGWDWHPRLIPSGIWDEIYVEEGNRVRTFEVSYRLSDDFTTANVNINSLIKFDEEHKLVVLNKEGKEVFSKQLNGESNNFNCILTNINLWWPNEQGDQYLYTFKLIVGEKEVVKKIGFKRARLIPQDCNWDIDSFPFTQALPPITLELNGKQIFCKGSNFVNPEIFVGTMTRDTYLPLVKLAKDAHFNIFRCWGGAPTNKDSFFELCDEMGIMIWQEFPLACNCYKDNDHYLEVLNNESIAIIKRVREHACHILWCGGNELYTGGSSMTEQFKALRLLNSNCFKLDEDKPYINTSPIMGMRHGHYEFKYPGGEECVQGFIRVKATAYTEFGTSAPSDYDYLEKFIPKEDMIIPTDEESWIAHHGLKAWEKDSWLHIGIIESYFGKCADLQDLINKGQILQCAGYKGMFEEGRRQRPRCNMVINWDYNEPWPTAANNSLVNYPAIPRQSYYAVANSLKCGLLSARVNKFQWNEGEVFAGELFLLNDNAFNTISAGKMVVTIQLNGKEVEILNWNYPECKPNTNIMGPTFRYLLPEKYKSGIFTLRLKSENTELNNEYQYLFYNKDTLKLMHDSVKDVTCMDFVGIEMAKCNGLKNVESIKIKK